MTEYVEYGWAEQPVHYHPAIAERIVSIIDAQPRGLVCELGCGSGRVCHRLAEKGFNVVGIDLSESGIRAACSVDVEGARFVHDAIDLRLPERTGLAGQCDVVLSNDVIEHLYRPADLLEAAKGLLKPGGLLVTATPYHGYLKNLAIALLGKADSHYNPLWDGGHIKFFSTNTLSRLLTENGFAVDRFNYVGRFWGLWMSMICEATPITNAEMASG